MRHAPSCLAVLLLVIAPVALHAADAEAKQEKDLAVQACLEEFRKAPKTSDEEKGAAVKMLARLKDPRLLNALLPLLADSSPAARIDVVKALGAYEKNPVASQALAGAIRAAHKEPEVEIACLKALGRVKDWGTAPTVIDFFNDGEPRVEKAALAAAGEFRSPDFVEELIDLLRDTGKRRSARGRSRRGGGSGKDNLHHAEAQEALREITGESKHATAEDWENWWKLYGARVTERLRKEDREARARAQKEEAGT